LLALAVAYEVQCRFSAQVPVMARGLNHALQLAMSVAAGSAKLLGLDESQTADAIAASAADNVSLAAVHAEPVSHWKGISPALTGMRAVYATMLAARRHRPAHADRRTARIGPTLWSDNRIRPR
ncbi:MmgE/PrpD family protein, partial [Mycobacterium asiaticum]|uniref:MmgE/PrpD family protein n=1 Tax=Mycobacterium asiaticum TaxID=1790 RepID=UPI001E30F7E3